MRTFPFLSVALLLAVGAVGCGHPATEAECQEILDRVVSLELKAQSVTDPAEIEKRRTSTLTGLSDGGAAPGREIYEGCVGKHITDKAMECVRAAKTADEITDGCLR